MDRMARGLRGALRLTLTFAAVAALPLGIQAFPAATPALAATCHSNGVLPDPTCQPGATNPDVTQSTIGSTICVSGWTKTVRPPTSYTTPLKVQQIAEYGYSDTNTADYEEDHLIPLELGGAPKDTRNLWPEPRNGASGTTASSKDSVENRLKSDVCAGRVTLSTARRAIAANWTTALQVTGG
jgi:hypothetical protein